MREPQSLDGTILGYSADVNAGLIQCDNGFKYKFGKFDWLSIASLPLARTKVTFFLDQGQAVHVKAA